MNKFESLRAFCCTIEEGGFAAAARKMEVSRSAVNKLVANLEDQLGVQLLYRTTRKVTPTDTGRAFYDRCKSILANLAEAEQLASQQHGEPKGTIKINAPMSFGTLYFGAIAADFMARYPEIQIQLTLDDRFIDPIAEGYDFVVRIAQPTASASLVIRPLIPIERIWCAAPAYLQKRGIPEHPQDLQNHSCLHYGYLATGSQWQFENAQGEKDSVAINGVLCSNNGEVLRDAAVRGLGIALLPAFIVRDEVQQGALKAILTHYHPPEIVLCAVYPVNRHLSTKIQLLTQFLRESLAREQFSAIGSVVATNSEL